MNGTSDEEDDGISHDIDYSRPNTILPLYNSNKRTDIFKERVTLNEQDLSASGICIKRTRKYVNNTEGANNLELNCVGTWNNLEFWYLAYISLL